MAENDRIKLWRHMAPGFLCIACSGVPAAAIATAAEAVFAKAPPSITGGNDEGMVAETNVDFREWAAGAGGRPLDETLKGLKALGFRCDRYDDPALLGESGGSAAWHCTRRRGTESHFVSIVLAPDGSVLKVASNSSQKGI